MDDQESKYWELDKVKMMDISIEDFMLEHVYKGKPCVMSVHKHSCARRKFPKLNEGDECYIDISESLMSAPHYVLCKVTYIRTGIIFYTCDEKEEEQWMEEFSITHYFSEPKEITVNLDPKYYKVIGSSGMMKVNYNYDTNISNNSRS